MPLLSCLLDTTHGTTQTVSGMQAHPPAMTPCVPYRGTTPVESRSVTYAPTREEVERVRKLWESWQRGEVDPMTSAALVWQVGRLLARIEHLEGLLAEQAR